MPHYALSTPSQFPVISIVNQDGSIVSPAEESDPLNWGYPFTTQPGIFATAMSIPLANDAFYLRAIGGGTITKIGLVVAVASGNISLSTYSNTGTGRNAVPGTRTATSGAVACPTAGYAEVALGTSITITPGDWFCISADNVTATFRTADSSGNQNDIGKGTRYRQATGHPAPATAGTLLGYSGRSIVLVGVA